MKTKWVNALKDKIRGARFCNESVDHPIFVSGNRDLHFLILNFFMLKV